MTARVAHRVTVTQRTGWTGRSSALWDAVCQQCPWSRPARTEVEAQALADGHSCATLDGVA